MSENHLTQKENDFIRVKRKNHSISFLLQTRVNKEQRMNHEVKREGNREGNRRKTGSKYDKGYSLERIQT